MNNLRIQPDENFIQSELAKMPLFNQDVISQTSTNVAPQNSPKSDDEKLVLKNLKPSIIEHSNLITTNNVEPHQEVNVVPTNLEKPAIKRKSKKKSAKKKMPSQKRNVVPLKFFGSLEEKYKLEIKAKEKGLSLSNYIRVSLGLTPNLIGRRKANDLLLDGGNLDLEIEDAFINLLN